MNQTSEQNHACGWSAVCGCVILIASFVATRSEARQEASSIRVTQSASIPTTSNLNDLPCDLTLPIFEFGPPAPGKRVRGTTEGWESTEVYHSLYLPTDWVANQRFPVIVEFAGNGGYKNSLGDLCSGKVEDTKLGFGLTGGVGFLWIGMPYVEYGGGQLRNALKWWGEIEETKRYCLATLRSTIQKFGGDSDRVILTGFSRGAIGCNVVGLHDDEIAAQWRAFFCHSHYDGALENKWYALGERELVEQRLERLNRRPQWISHELSVEKSRDYLKRVYPNGQFTFESLPYANHSDAWILRDIPLREMARSWLQNVLKE